MIREALSALRWEGGRRMRTALAGDEPLSPEELAGPGDLGLFGPASTAWRVHGESSMLIGGLRALLLQTLHPLVMAGVADHSGYRSDPWGRLHRTGAFISATTFGSTPTAERAIETVSRVHDRIVGTSPDGRAYAANDPHLLLWVHITEVDSFLAAYQQYGSGRLTDAEQDRYVAEMAEVARRLGTETPPTNRAELAACIESYRPECAMGRQAKDAIAFILVPPVSLPGRGPYRAVAAGAIGLLPPWARRELHMPLPPGLDALAIRPAAMVVSRTIGWLMNEQSQRDRDDRMLSV